MGVVAAGSGQRPGSSPNATAANALIGGDAIKMGKMSIRGNLKPTDPYVSCGKFHFG
jgi:hypothetical protein